ncbi:ParA family protein [Ornithobacterium rhinotracheale]|uniref:ParA family protein n=1 Tax=Ornithobacterium rhinotracheale TaxID=28251 RepID=UPI003FA47FDA
MSRIITFSHQKGGVGKSTLCFNIAKNISKNTRVCLVDFDQQGSLSQVSEMVEFDIKSNVDVKDILNMPYDFIFIDTPPYLSSNLEEIYKISDLVVIPTKAGILDLFAIRSTINLVKSCKKQNNALIVFNLVKHNTSLTKDILKEVEMYGIEVSKTQISDLVAFTRSVLMNGVEHSNVAQRQIDDLTKEILLKII